MRIGVIQASSRADMHELLVTLTREAAPGSEVISFGCYPGEETYSYIEVAVEAGLLLSSGAVDFIVTGCSSGQGVMLACNAMPGVVCGYLPTPQDAYLFGRINAGNAASLPLGLNFGWAGELNLRGTLTSLFDGEMGTGYPPGDAERKRRDTQALRALRAAANVSAEEHLLRMDRELLSRALSRKIVTDYILENGNDPGIMRVIRSLTGTEV